MNKSAKVVLGLDDREERMLGNVTPLAVNGSKDERVARFLRQHGDARDCLPTRPLLANHFRQERRNHVKTALG